MKLTPRSGHFKQGAYERSQLAPVQRLPGQANEPGGSASI